MISPRDKANTQRVNFMSGMSGGNSPVKLENVSDCDGMGENSVSDYESNSTPENRTRNRK